jgi:quercetin dioxygenase-like cupin family protein
LALATRASGVTAQEATPPAGIAPIELAPGVTAEVFAGVPSDRASGQTLYLARFTFQPGAAIFPHSHPGTTVLGVASGQFGWTLLAGTAHVLRGAAAGATGPAEDLTEVNADVVLVPGDATFYEEDVVHTARSAGTDPAIVLGTLVLTAGAPLLMPMNMNMGTPAATPTGRSHKGRRPLRRTRPRPAGRGRYRHRPVQPDGRAAADRGGAAGECAEHAEQVINTGHRSARIPGGTVGRASRPTGPEIGPPWDGHAQPWKGTELPGSIRIAAVASPDRGFPLWQSGSG